MKLAIAVFFLSCSQLGMAQGINIGGIASPMGGRMVQPSNAAATRSAAADHWCGRCPCILDIAKDGLSLQWVQDPSEVCKETKNHRKKDAATKPK